MKTKSFIAAALAILACACSKEQAVEAVPDGAEVGVTFTAELPGMQTKTIGDGLTAKNLTVAVYEDNAGTAGDYIPALDKTAQFTALTTNVEFNLVKGKTYHFIFWAQADNAPYTLDATAKTVSVDYAGEANDENRDAFYAVKTLKVQGAATEPVQLKRPFAQVNFGTADFTEAVAGGVEVTKSTFTATDAATTLDLFAGEGKDETDITYTGKELPAETLTLKDGTTYKYMAMNYFVPAGKFAESHVSNVKAQFISAAHTVEISSPSTPVQSNWRTNIVGNLLTDQIVFNVEIVPAFEDDVDIDVQNITTASGLRTALASGYSVKLAADIDIADAKPMSIAGRDAVIDLNGHTIANSVDIWDVNYPEGDPRRQVSLIVVDGGTLTVKGQGTIAAKADDCYTFNVKNGGKLVIEDGEFVGNVSVVQVQEGTAEIYGGHFSLSQTWPSVGNGHDYTINMIDAAYRAGTANAFVYGGEFEKFNPGDNRAEGEHTNFLATGYKATKFLDVWYVTKNTVAPVVPASGQSDLDDILSSGAAADVRLASGTYKLPASIADGVSITGQAGTEVIDGSETATVTAKNFTVSNVVVRGSGSYINGSSLAINGSNSTVSNCTFKSGRQWTYGSDLSISQPAGSVTTVSSCDFRKSGYRGVMIWATGDEVKIDNCLFDNTYPFNVDAGNGKITVTDSELKGWTSYTNTLEQVSFTNCKFGKSTSGYAYLVPYCKTVVKDCTFSSDFLVSPSDSCSETFTIEFVNCRYEDGTPIDSSIMDTVGVNTNATWTIDGQPYSY